MSDNLLISVVMPVFNAERYLSNAVDSILAQTLSNLELIVIDDGSSDKSLQILMDYAKKDDRVKIICFESNQGIVKALNAGLLLARGRYLSRMDADDISLPERLQKQVRFLETNPSVGIVGCAVQRINSNGDSLGITRYPENDLAVRWSSLFSSPFAHPSVTIRRELLESNDLKYRQEMSHVEDFDLWVRLLNYTKGCNLSAPLLKYRVHSQSITSNYTPVDRNKRLRVSLTSIKNQLPGFIVSRSKIDMVLRVFFDPRERSGLNQRAFIANVYLDMWDSFQISRGKSSSLYGLETEIYLTAARLAIYPPFQKGSWSVFRRLFIKNPLWVWRLIRHLPLMLKNRLYNVLRNRISQFCFYN